MGDRIYGPADYLELGDWNAVCSICGAKEKASKLVKNWKGMWRHPAGSSHGCNEPRQPQDFVRGVQDIQAVPWSQRDEGIYLQVCTFNGQSAIPGFAIPGCSIPGRTALLEVDYNPPTMPPPSPAFYAWQTVAGQPDYWVNELGQYWETQFDTDS